MHIIAESYFRGASELGLPVTIVEDIDGFQLTLGKNNYFFRGGMTPFNNGSTNNVADNKYCVNKILEKAGFPVTKTIGLSKEEFLTNNWNLQDLKFPLVIKPMLGTSCGKDVLCNIKDLTALEYHLANKFEHHQYLSIEEFYDHLHSYRVLIFYGKILGVVKRVPAQVICDGKHNILELIDIENENRLKFKGKVTFGELNIDEETNIILDELKLTPQSIPREGEIIKLCYACNSSRGGSIFALDKRVLCKENARLCLEAAKVLNLNIVGFDFACENINIPIEKSKGIIIEANYHPDVTLHESPMYGIKIPANKIIMRKFIFMHPINYCYHFLMRKINILLFLLQKYANLLCLKEIG